MGFPAEKPSNPAGSPVDHEPDRLQDGYLGAEIETVHKPTVTPSDALPAPGSGPTNIVLGTLIGLHYDNATDKAYTIVKIDSSFHSDGAGPGGSDSGANASFHVHWSKAVNTDQSGASVQWKLSYTVFDGSSDEVVDSSPTVLLFDDVYESSGTTGRVVHRTKDLPAPGFRPRYYVGVLLEYVAAETTLAGGPVVISTDLLLSLNINGERR